MKTTILLFVFSLTLASAFAQEVNTLSEAQISFVFTSKDVKGTLSGFSSTSTVDLNNLTNSKFKGSVKAETIDSGNFLRNWSLKGSKYFDAENYPELSFESTSVTENQTGFAVKGTLTIKGTSKPVTIDFKKNGDQLIGTTTIYSSDFGITIIKKSKEANAVKVTLAFKVN
ncbi:MAG: YceI family protein [Flavobacteriaceae bacterium]